MNSDSSLINGEWVMGKRIGSGAFGNVFLTANITTNTLAALKIEDRRLSELLPTEAMIVKQLSGIGRLVSDCRRFPKILLGWQ